MADQLVPYQAAADAALVAEVARLQNETKRLALLKELGRDIS